MQAIGVMAAAAILGASAADDWVRIDGAEGAAGKRVIHAMKAPPPPPVKPGIYQIETVEIFEKPGDLETALSFNTLEINCTRKTYRQIDMSTVSAHGASAYKDLSKSAFKPLPAKGAAAVYAAAVCDKIRGPLQPFPSFDATKTNTLGYFLGF